jgi:hypothetical protein
VAPALLPWDTLDLQGLFLFNPLKLITKALSNSRGHNKKGRHVVGPSSGSVTNPPNGWDSKRIRWFRENSREIH